MFFGIVESSLYDVVKVSLLQPTTFCEFIAKILQNYSKTQSVEV